MPARDGRTRGAGGIVETPPRRGDPGYPRTLARYAVRLSIVPDQPCVMLAKPSSKVRRSSAEARYGSHRTLTTVASFFTSWSANVIVESISSGHVGANGARIACPEASANDTMK